MNPQINARFCKLCTMTKHELGLILAPIIKGKDLGREPWLITGEVHEILVHEFGFGQVKEFTAWQIEEMEDDNGQKN